MPARRQLQGHWELADSEEPHHASWKGKGPARSHAETEYRLTPVDGGTRFDYRNEFKAPLGPLGAVASRALVGGLPEREADARCRGSRHWWNAGSGAHDRVHLRHRDPTVRCRRAAPSRTRARHRRRF